jgi:hypothetical protein
MPEDILARMSEGDAESSNGDYTSYRSSEIAGMETDESKIMRDKIIKEEEKAVKKARLLVVVALFLCLAAVTSAIYIFASNGDQYSFELEVRNQKQASPCPYPDGAISNALSLA